MTGEAEPFMPHAKKACLIDDGQLHRSICQLLGLKEISELKARYGSEQNESIYGEEIAHTILARYHSFTQSWVCQSAANRSVVGLGQQSIQRGIAAINRSFEK